LNVGLQRVALRLVHEHAPHAALHEVGQSERMLLAQLGGSGRLDVGGGGVGVDLVAERRGAEDVDDFGRRGGLRAGAEHNGQAQGQAH
jgi:hypothetical protein